MFEYLYNIIGMLLVYPKLFDNCILSKNHFDSTLGLIFEEMQKLYQKDHDILIDKLFLVDGIDIDMILRCQDVAFTANVEQFNMLQQMAIDEYKKREITRITNDMSLGKLEIEEYDAEYKKIMDMKISKPEYLTARGIIDSCTKNNKTIIFSRFKQFGYKLKLYQGDLMVLAGGTGVGKTCLALNILDDLSKRYSCVYFNMEMAPDVLNKRLAALKSKVPIAELEYYDGLSKDKKDNIGKAVNEIEKNKITVISESQSIEKLRNVIASFDHKEHMIMFIDHIGLISSRKCKNAYERVTEIAKEIRRMCLDYNCTFIVLSQLSRIGKEDTKPRLSMLRDSGELEQSARKVVFIWEHDSGDEKAYEIVIEKNDSNFKGIVNIDFAKTTQFISERT